MNIGILGSGFGLYGYLPAVIELGHTPLILDRKIGEIYRRPELSKYAAQCSLIESIEDMCSRADSLVIATPPLIQTSLVTEISSMKKFAHIFLEKPLGVNSHQGQEMLRELQRKGNRFSLAYLFLWTEWFNEISNLIKVAIADEGVSISLNWVVSRSPNSWKSAPEIGGGLIDFYCTHVFAIYWKLGFRLDEIFLNPGLESFEISAFKANKVSLTCKVEFGDSLEFKVQKTGTHPKVIYAQSTPFGAQNQFGFPDSRISILKKYLFSAIQTDENDYYLIESFVNSLRHEVENSLN